MMLVKQKINRKIFTEKKGSEFSMEDKNEEIGNGEIQRNEKDFGGEE